MRVSNKRALALSLASIAPLSYITDHAAAASTFLGDAINYNFGTVQVQITVDSANQITQIDTPQVSTRGSNASYTNYALPILVKEALAAQTANIQGVSGASYLSRGWITSLASAIAKEGNVINAPAPTPTASPTVKPMSPQMGEGENQGENQGEKQGGEQEGGEHRDLRSPAPLTSRTPAPIIKSPAATPTPVDPGLVLKPGAGVIQKSITCVKGATKKVIKGLNPKCPTGFTLKKP
jgi:uncharacterized protein with FMN-binding domain